MAPGNLFIVLCGLLVVGFVGLRYRKLRRAAPPVVPAQASGFTVELRCATLPGRLGYVAVHYWFVAVGPENQAPRRWEVWQTPDAGGTNWGHVHRDMLPPDANVGGGPTVVRAVWHGEPARQLFDALECSPAYPWWARYRAWPGPNSNTYVAWVLRRAGVAAELEPRAVGRDYLGAFGAALTTTRTGIQIETPLIGLRVGLRDGLEVHVLALTVGVDLCSPAVKTPFGRFGLTPWSGDTPCTPR